MIVNKLITLYTGYLGFTIERAEVARGQVRQVWSENLLDYAGWAGRYDERHLRGANPFSAVESAVASPVSSW